MIRRDSTGDDTGEQDVRELRQHFAKNEPLPTNDPFVRHKEDVPHEGSLPDFYGLDDEIDMELSALVDAGELCMGWDSETQEVIYWLPEEPELAEQPEPAPKHSRRAPKPRKRSKLYRRALLTVVASVAPFFVGMTAEAAMDMRSEPTHPLDQPDLAGADAPSPSDQPTTYDDYRPTGAAYSNAARHAKVTTSPTVEKPGSYVGKHRKTLPKKVAETVKATKKPESKTPKPDVKATPAPAVKATPAPAVTTPAAPKQAPRTPIEDVVTGVLGTVHSLLG